MKAALIAAIVAAVVSSSSAMAANGFYNRPASNSLYPESTLVLCLNADGSVTQLNGNPKGASPCGFGNKPYTFVTQDTSK